MPFSLWAETEDEQQGSRKEETVIVGLGFHVKVNG